MLRVALIGCGNIGVRAHLPACAQVPETEVVAVCDIIGERAQAAAERSGAIVQDARAALEMTLAAQRSAETGQPVSLPLG